MHSNRGHLQYHSEAVSQALSSNEGVDQVSQDCVLMVRECCRSECKSQVKWLGITKGQKILLVYSKKKYRRVQNTYMYIGNP